MEQNQLFLQAAESSLRFEYHAGDVTPMVPGYSTGWRTLPSLTLAQVMNGTQSVEMGDGQEYRLKAREALCIAPGMMHKSDNVSGGINVSRWAHINVYLFGSLDISALIAMPVVLSGETAQCVGAISEELAILHQAQPMELQHILQKQALGFRLAAMLCKSSTTHAHAQVLLQHAERLAPALAYINDNLAQPLSRESLARQMHLSPSRFYALFKLALGVSPTEYMQNLRMQRAQRLLLSSELGIAEIAARTGYADAFHFSRTFRKCFGISPLQYRKQVLPGPH